MNIAEALKNKKESHQTIFSEFESKKLLQEIGIHIPAQKLTTSREETVAAAEEIGFPIVLKLIAEDIIHKSDTGAVKLNLKTKNEVTKAFNELLEIPSQNEKKISVQKIKSNGMNFYSWRNKLWAKNNHSTTRKKIVSFRIAPITQEDAKEMIHEIKGFPILDGYRGKPKFNC
ncbi:hypothetical protein LCGC14_0816090 [marine sediment metagenome]|uniref:ATP-grasp domain-containing protein n=1 Tax=marine sediment metagenome TaxID=412755 RepID=A0A0F9S551_9ZZZZ